MRKTVSLLAAAAFGISASAASASTLQGEFWDVAPNTIATIDDAIAAVGGGTAATTATFTSTSIAYGDAGTNWAIGSLSDFLNADAGSIVGTNSGSIQESVIRLTGMVTLNDGDLIDVTSDDGFRLFIGGSMFTEFNGLRGPNNTTSATWNGGSGTFAATLWYFEGNVTQAQLQSNLGRYAAPVPVPASALLLLTSLAGFGAWRRKSRR